jgi:hypothetical protein
MGDLLVDLATLPDNAPAIADAKASARAQLTENRSHVLDRANLALEAFRATGDRWFADVAHGIARDLVDAYRETRRWLPPVGGADRHQLSILWGLPAVVRLFLYFGRGEIPFTQPRLVDKFDSG